MALSKRLARVLEAHRRGEVQIKDRDLRAMERWMAIADGKASAEFQANPLVAYEPSTDEPLGRAA